VESAKSKEKQKKVTEIKESNTVQKYLLVALN
jgi:hypothetical protein